MNQQTLLKSLVLGAVKNEKEGYEIAIVDTSGINMQESALFEEMKEIENEIKQDEMIFVLDGTIGQTTFDQARAFSQAVKVGSIIITKLDSNARGGGALSAVAATNSTISFFGVGEGINDLFKFSPASFVSRMLGRGDNEALTHMLKLVDDPETYEHL